MLQIRRTATVRTSVHRRGQLVRPSEEIEPRALNLKVNSRPCVGFQEGASDPPGRKLPNRRALIVSDKSSMLKTRLVIDWK